MSYDTFPITKVDIDPALSAYTFGELNDFYDKITHWFEVIGKELHDPIIVPENIYNMDETGVMLCMLSSMKVLVSKDDSRAYRGAGVKREMVTAIECISSDGRSSDDYLAGRDPSKQLDHIFHPWMALCVLSIWIH
jgi:hypothetical protein